MRQCIAMWWRKTITSAETTRPWFLPLFTSTLLHLHPEKNATTTTAPKMLNKQTHSEPSSDLWLRPRPDYGSARDFEPDFFRMDPGRGSGSNCWAGAASEPAVALWLYSTCPAPPPPTHPHSWPILVNSLGCSGLVNIRKHTKRKMLFHQQEDFWD